MGGAATKEDVEGDEPDADTQMRDSFFGLHTKPTISPAPFPTRAVAQRLVDLYFEHANPQIPSLQPGRVRAGDYGIHGAGLGGTARERYLLNIVCAIGAGIFLTGPDEGGNNDGRHSDHERERHEDETTQSGPRKKQKTEKEKPKQYEPEAYHASAMLHLESFLSQSKGGLEELQAVLLLASYALLRPVSPGLWYIVGVALRLAVDLGLHYEDADLESKKAAKTGPKTEKDGRREWVRDMRRRLWWCVYSLDRLVSTCVGRPFGIADEVISTQFPSLLDDDYIHPTTGITPPPPGTEKPSYKLISHHYFRLRLLQSEILQVLQQQSHAFSFGSPGSEHAFKRDIYKGKENYPPHHPYHLQTPYLLNHGSLQSWHADVDRRLQAWIEGAPKSKQETGVAFSPEFLELNYWQAKIMLYRPCLSVPVLLAGELSANAGNARSKAAERGMGAPSTRGRTSDHEDRVYLVVAEAGRKVLRLYRQLHRVHQVNYTFLATHHLFMAGISFLYAIWHSPLVRSQLSIEEIDFTILAATSVLGDLVGKCPPAEACRDAFVRMSRATVQMCLAGAAVRPTYQPPPPQVKMEFPQQPQQQVVKTEYGQQQQPQQRHPQQRQPVQFDDGFRDLFTSPRPPHMSPISPYSPHPGPPSYVVSPTTPTEGLQYQSLYPHPQHPQQHQPMYSQQQPHPQHPQHPQHQPHPPQQLPPQDLMIDPALQPFPPPAPLSSDWANIDMSQFGAEWEPDSWSEEGVEGVDGGGGVGGGGVGGGVGGGLGGGLGGVGQGGRQGGTGGLDLFDGFFFGGGGN
ncbi:fungal-specific transcription factor domain-containing protein [Geopyxis carbonaria]|nr:fungal-specific transcription factor domain-containing protein [Geopyxis carbonaria]